MKRYTRAAIILAVGVLCVFALYRLAAGNALNVRFSLPVLPEGTQVRAEADRPELIEIGEPVIHGDSVWVNVIPRAPGESELCLLDSQGESVGFTVLKISGLLTVCNEADGSFSGGGAALVCLTVFVLGISVILLRGYLSARGPAFYAYSTIFCAGGFLFTFVSGVILLVATLRYLFRPEEMLMNSVYSTICCAGSRFLFYTFPAVFIFSVAMVVSNIELLRLEGFRKTNVLALGVSLLLILGEAVGWYLFTRDFMGSEWEGRVRNTLVNTYATVFVYFQCMLMGAVTCGLLAARHRPDPDKDFIIILGCWFRKDGTLPPLLRGRVDKALEFWRGQKKKTGREARFIPSGGQGENETMPEAEAIRQYLLREGIDDRLILKEDASKNTWQNMTNSKGIIQETGGGKTIFATTNYHVFRSGLWARQAGLNAEGIGSKTKWWFWPNAFMRETLGLLQKRWKTETVMLILMIVYFSLLTITLG